MLLTTEPGVRLAVLKETVHYAALPGVYTGKYRRNLPTGQVNFRKILRVS